MEKRIREWCDVRSDVLSLNSELAKIIDRLDPGKEHRLYSVDYEYGSYIVKQGKLQLPSSHTKTLQPISSNSFSNKIKEDLNYNDQSNPVSILLKNTSEIYVNLLDRIIPLYGLISPGKIFSTWGVLSSEWSYAAAFSWNMTAGARSIFMSQKISDKQAHRNIQRSFNIKNEPPRSLSEHWKIFRNIANDNTFGVPWKTSILFFSKAWFDHKDDIAWRDFYYYLHKSAWSGSEFWRNQFLWDLALTMIQKDRNIKPCPYISDTVRHLLTIGSGDVYGFAPPQNDLAAPIGRITQIYKEVYKMYGCPPMILVPSNITCKNNMEAVYYSLNFPNSMKFSTKSNEQSSLINDLREIKSLLRIHTDDLVNKGFNIENTPIYKAAQSADFSFFHSESDLHYDILQNSRISKEDSRFPKVDKENFPTNSPFFRSCIRIKNKL